MSVGAVKFENVLECEAEWTIPDFVKRPKDHLNALVSPSFPLKTEENVDWTISLYPHKYYVLKGKRRDCIGLYLDARSRNQDIQFTIIHSEFSLQNVEGELVETKMVKRHSCRTGYENHLGIANFIPWRVILASQDELLPNGNLVVVCRIKTFVKASASFISSESESLSWSRAASSTSLDISNIYLKLNRGDERFDQSGRSTPISNHNSIHPTAYLKQEAASSAGSEDGGEKAPKTDFIIDTMEKLLKEGICSDVVLKCSGRKFQCHKSILAAHSTFFHQMFLGEVEETEIEMDNDMTPKAVEDLLSFVYTGKMKNLSENSFILFNAAEKYGLSDLKKLSKMEIVAKLTPETAMDILVFAQKSGAKELKKLAAEYIYNSE